MTEADVILYTAQQPVVLEALKRDGRSVVRREYIDKKYGDTSWVFQEAYSFFRQTAFLFPADGLHDAAKTGGCGISGLALP